MRQTEGMDEPAPFGWLDDHRLVAIADAHREGFAEALPFPHVVLDDLFPEAVVSAVLEEFRRAEGEDWPRFEGGLERKQALRDERRLGPVTRGLIHRLHSGVFVEFLERLTGIDGLLPDPHLGGGGLHRIERGGYLKIHADFNRHPKLRLDRRLNLLLFLNRDWKEEYGGHLELWDETMTTAVRRILPEFNRCVVFATTDTSFHGHPDPLRCPPDRSRRSLALYYYTAGRPQAERSAAHSTLFRPRPGEETEPGFEPAVADQPRSGVLDGLRRWLRRG